jgi:hypothetical protein
MRMPIRWLCIPLALLAVLATLGLAAGQEPTGTVQIIQGGTGQGTITSDPAGIDCTLGSGGPSGTCEATFEAGTKVRLKAEAAPGSKFEGWAPVTSCPKPKNLTIEAGGTHECQPVFSFTEPPEFLLQTFLVGSGTVTSEPAGIDCTRDEDAETTAGQCGNLFPNGSTVTLTATPAAGWALQGWSGVDRDRDCEDGVVTMDQRHSCTATFVRVQ